MQYAPVPDAIGAMIDQGIAAASRDLLQARLEIVTLREALQRARGAA